MGDETRILLSFRSGSHGQRFRLTVGFRFPITRDHRKLRGDRGSHTGISRRNPWLVVVSLVFRLVGMGCRCRRVSLALVQKSSLRD
jgi:hypothetical protein